MGEVYFARDTRFDRKVAVEVLAPELADNADFGAGFVRDVLRRQPAFAVPA
jgi:serine/threonine protein kinase